MDDGRRLDERDQRFTAAGAIFAWRGDAVVLLVEQAGERWVVARGWRSGDRLLHVRRWSFPCSRTLAGQVRRLVREATGEAGYAADVACAMLAWAVAPERKDPEVDLDPAAAHG